jgi:hypothetical protein
MDPDPLAAARLAEIAAHNEAMRLRALADSTPLDDVTLFAQAVHRIQANPELSGYNLGVVQVFLARLTLAPHPSAAPPGGVGPLATAASPSPARVDALPVLQSATSALAPLAGPYAPLVGALGPVLEEVLARVFLRLESSRSNSSGAQP